MKIEKKVHNSASFNESDDVGRNKTRKRRREEYQQRKVSLKNEILVIKEVLTMNE
jgi:hypothetical protein